MASLIHMVTAVAAVLMVSAAAAIGGAEAQADSNICTDGVRRLTVCAPSVVPGNNSGPSSDCCSALQGVDSDCLCNTLRIAYQLPSQCQLPPFTCLPSGALGNDG